MRWANDLKIKSFSMFKELFDKALKRVNTFVDFRTESVEESSKKADVIEESSMKAKADTTQESSSKKAREELVQESSKKQKVDENNESEELKKNLEIVPNDGDDVTIEATPLSIKILIMLKNFDREDLEVLWGIVKARFKKTKPVNYMDEFLLLNLKTMFEHHVEDSVWKEQQGLVKVLNWKLFDSCGVHCVTVQSISYYLLVEKKYPLTNHTLHQMFHDVKLQVDYECEMAYELLRLKLEILKINIKFKGGLFGLKDFMMILELMLLVYKLLLLVFKVTTAEKIKTAERIMTEKRSKTYQRKDKDCLCDMYEIFL
ncbi:hypothetical protein Tco_0954016 [Tanacetum coccineum]|uniref:Uncharacterized protein n=1 Tax=Tanacetum coccineum TaxID=301880 RepID=A0ABQ5E3M0_9ASTR